MFKYCVTCDDQSVSCSRPTPNEKNVSSVLTFTVFARGSGRLRSGPRSGRMGSVARRVESSCPDPAKPDPWDTKIPRPNRPNNTVRFKLLLSRPGSILEF